MTDPPSHLNRRTVFVGGDDHSDTNEMLAFGFVFVWIAVSLSIALSGGRWFLFALVVGAFVIPFSIALFRMKGAVTCIEFFADHVEFSYSGKPFSLAYQNLSYYVSLKGVSVSGRPIDPNENPRRSAWVPSDYPSYSEFLSELEFHAKQPNPYASEE